MVLKLYGSPLSTCTRRVGQVLYEKRVPYEVVVVDLAKGEHKAPDFVAQQPFGQIPYIDDDGFIVFESRAIARYLSLKYADQGSKLLPSTTDLKATAIFEQGVSIEQSNFDVPASKAVYENVFKPRFGGTPDPAVFSSLIEQLDNKLRAYEVILGKQQYIGGDEFSLADIFHIPYGTMLETAGSDILSKQGPNVTRWWKDITSRPSWQAVKDGLPLKNTF